MSEPRFSPTPRNKRYSGPKDLVISSLAFDRQDHEVMYMIAEELGLSRSDLIRQIVREFIDSYYEQ